MSLQAALPADIRVFERGWLSSNNILLLSDSAPALVDSGYATHASQTVALVENALGAQALALLVNTHLHSDHCGGNALLQARYPHLPTLIPPGHAEQVRRWDAKALSYLPTGQSCSRFVFESTLEPGSTLRLGQRDWQVHAAPGHDPHSVILFEPELRLLISADALWENGFGVVFPEIEGADAFSEVTNTLDLIESLQPRFVIPGHGSIFQDVTAALHTARQRLIRFIAAPERHAWHAAKVLLKFKLLEQQRIALADLQLWAEQTPYFSILRESYFADRGLQAWLNALIEDLLRSGAAALERESDQTILVNQEVH
jgi:glyoxylase-like metal-dependent hydrolase (beta-lactamase superfamily II)